MIATLTNIPLVWGEGTFDSQVEKLGFSLANPARGLAKWFGIAPPVRAPRNQKKFSCFL